MGLVVAAVSVQPCDWDQGTSTCLPYTTGPMWERPVPGTTWCTWGWRTEQGVCESYHMGAHGAGGQHSKFGVDSSHGTHRAAGTQQRAPRMSYHMGAHGAEGQHGVAAAGCHMCSHGVITKQYIFGSGNALMRFFKKESA
jgi:hypothetical protein